MLSGIGEAAQLRKYDIPVVVSSPGVGKNLQGRKACPRFKPFIALRYIYAIDRLEMTTVWDMKNNWTIYDGCTFGSDPATDPCLKTWIDDGRKNLYSSGASILSKVVSKRFDMT